MTNSLHAKRHVRSLVASYKLAEKSFVRSAEAVRPTPEVMRLVAESTARAKKARNAAFLDQYRMTS